MDNLVCNDISYTWPKFGMPWKRSRPSAERQYTQPHISSLRTHLTTSSHRSHCSSGLTSAQPAVPSNSTATATATANTTVAIGNRLGGRSPVRLTRSRSAAAGRIACSNSGATRRSTLLYQPLSLLHHLLRDALRGSLSRPIASRDAPALRLGFLHLLLLHDGGDTTVATAAAFSGWKEAVVFGGGGGSGGGVGGWRSWWTQWVGVFRVFCRNVGIRLRSRRLWPRLEE